MEKKITPLALVTKSVTEKIPAYDWKSQGTDTVKYGTSRFTRNQLGEATDSWAD